MSTLLKIIGIAIITCLGMLFIGHLCLEHNSAKTLSQVIQHHHLLFTVWRYALYGLVLILWPYFIEKVGARQKWSAQVVDYLSHQRFKLLGLFAFIEAFFVYNLLGHLFAWL